MADWKYSYKRFTYNDAAESDLQSCAIKIEYDADTATPESLTIQFVLTGYATYGTDGCNILFNPVDSNSPGQLLELKKAKETVYPYYSEPVTLTKEYTAEAFTLPAFWVCNTGNNLITNSPQVHFEAFKPGGVRANYVCRKDTSEIAVKKTAVTPVTPGTVEIIDNYDNTFSVIGTKGTSGANNPAGDVSLYWGYTSECVNKIPATAITKNSLIIKDPTAATKTVYAKSITAASHGSPAEAITSAAIRQYAAPGASGIPDMALVSFTNGKLDTRKDWAFTWTNAPAANSSSKVIGYRVRLYKNNKLTDIYKDGQIVSTTSGNDKYYDTETPASSFIINPPDYNFTTGDSIQLKIMPYTRYGLRNDGKILLGDTMQSSKIFTVHKSSPIKIRVGNKWEDGTIYVKNILGWHEATALYIKTEDNEWFDWKEWANTGYTR
jgi:hypothetical protein